MEDEDEELYGLGATFKDVGDVEKQLLERMQSECAPRSVESEESEGAQENKTKSKHEAEIEPATTSGVEEEEGGGGGGGRKGGDDAKVLVEQLKAVRRELLTVQSAIDQMATEQEDREADGGSNANQNVIDNNQLQKVLMEDRMAGLETQRTQLESQLRYFPNSGAKAVSDQALFEEDDLFGADNIARSKALSNRSLIETEKDRLIRLGIITPFDNIGGFERKVLSNRHASDDSKLKSNIDEMDQQQRDMSIQKVGRKVRELKELRHTSMLLDPSELPRPEKAARKVDERFWRAATSINNIPTKRPKRTVTLSRHPIDGEGGNEGEEQDLDVVGKRDDTDDAAYERRIRAVAEANEAHEEEDLKSDNDDSVDVTFEGGFTIPGTIFSKLFDYQKTGVKWLWELHTQRAGGVLGDEMGLGKTIQIIAFLAGLHHSGLFRPSLIICPATVLTQWLRELRTWYPPFRVSILHDSVAGGRKGNETYGELIRRIKTSDAGIVLTTYDQLRLRREDILPVRWGYVVLDEGHKIRNPDAEVTLVAKQLATVHRLIMTGSPIQNRLTELWSLFDFVFPGKLGTLPVFQAQFAIPIQIGGYANASALQVSTAYKCAIVLRDLIAPYLLRRRKADVAASLPKKTERVLFCTLTSEQREMYRSYLASKELSDILAGNRAALAGIDILRKICNHPDLLERGRWEGTGEYGDVERSGKLVVLMKVLMHWQAQGHKVLIFTQTQQMLDIIEKSMGKQDWKYHRMDGSTPLALRTRYIDDFNSNPGVFAFLLTTRVGGLGVNLTGANRCVIYDPDWNPSTDIQARERAWRIGQSREVTVYRLITSGTIEEKVYHRQVYKQFLTDRVLKDPRQKRFFKAKDLADLFTLGDEYTVQGATETAEIFASLNTEVLDDGGIEAADNVGQDGPDNDAPQLGKIENENHGNGNGNGNETEIQPDRRGTGSREGGGGILKDLLDGLGIHAALDHDKIEQANDPEHRIAQREAARIARRAAEALKRSSRPSSAPVNQPTWTGRSGSAGAPLRFGSALNPRLGGAGGSAGAGSGSAGNGLGAGGMRSADLLARIRQRQEGGTTMGATGVEENETGSVMQAQRLAQQVAIYLIEQGPSTSADVAAQFQNSIRVRDVALFKNVLKQVAVLERRRGNKVWVLRPEFTNVANVAT